MVGSTGTYLDSPFHRYADGGDLSSIPLERVADLPAVLLHTGGDVGFGTPSYAVDAPYLTGEGAAWLATSGAVLVGIDAVNIDDVSPDAVGARPAHSLLLAAGIYIVEHLTGLAALPVLGARFSAVPPPVAGFGTFPVRAYASVPRS